MALSSHNDNGNEYNDNNNDADNDGKDNDKDDNSDGAVAAAGSGWWRQYYGHKVLSR
jgi:hypothetical protein